MSDMLDKVKAAFKKKQQKDIDSLKEQILEGLMASAAEGHKSYTILKADMPEYTAETLEGTRLALSKEGISMRISNGADFTFSW
jgi:hypothetical protein